MKDLVAKLKEFIKTPLGKVALVAVILLVVVFSAAFVMGVFLLVTNLGGTTQKVSKVPVQVQKTTETETTGAKKSTEETGTAKSDEDATFKVYEYKDPFQPLIQAEATGTATSTATSATTTTASSSTEQPTGSSAGTNTGPQVLEVQDIFDENSVNYASIKYGATVYKVKQGERVDDSPYEVLTIGADSVTFLYGDRRVEVSVGESILK